MLDGGGGLDVASFAYAKQGVTVDLGEFGDGYATGEGQDALHAIWGAVGSAHDDVMFAGDRSAWLAGGAWR